MTALDVWTRVAIVVLVVGSTLIFGWYLWEVWGRLRSGEAEDGGHSSPRTPPDGS